MAKSTAGVTWAQRKDTLFVTINVADVDKSTAKIELEGSKLVFTGTSNGKEYTADLELFGEVRCAPLYAVSWLELWAKNIAHLLAELTLDDVFVLNSFAPSNCRRLTPLMRCVRKPLSCCYDSARPIFFCSRRFRVGIRLLAPRVQVWFTQHPTSWSYSVGFCSNVDHLCCRPASTTSSLDASSFTWSRRTRRQSSGPGC